MRRLAEGITYVVHTAAVVKLTAPDPKKEIVDANIQMTRHVLECCVEAFLAGKNSLKAITVTSSIAAILDLSQPRGGYHSG